MDRILLDIVCTLTKMMNFWVAKISGDNGTLYGDTKIVVTASSRKAFHGKFQGLKFLSITKFVPY